MRQEGGDFRAHGLEFKGLMVWRLRVLELGWNILAAIKL